MAEKGENFCDRVESISYFSVNVFKGFCRDMIRVYSTSICLVLVKAAKPRVVWYGVNSFKPMNSKNLKVHTLLELEMLTISIEREITP